jgi:RNA polymerase sigma-70 factor (ECF subfamily)
LNNAADAEDATQEIFIELWKSAHRFDPSLGSEVVFVSTIARRRLIDRLRAQGRRPPTEEFDEQMIPNETHNEQYFASDVDRAARALESLEAGQREVLVMGVVQGMTHSEIALATGKPLGTVKTQLRRGLSKVRAMLEAGVELEVKEADE